MSALTTVHPTAKKTSAKQNSHDDSKYPVRNLHCTETDLKSPTHIPASSDSSGMPRVRSNIIYWKLENKHLEHLHTHWDRVFAEAPTNTTGNWNYRTACKHLVLALGKQLPTFSPIIPQTHTGNHSGTSARPSPTKTSIWNIPRQWASLPSRVIGLLSWTSTQEGKHLKRKQNHTCAKELCHEKGRSAMAPKWSGEHVAKKTNKTTRNNAHAFWHGSLSSMSVLAWPSLRHRPDRGRRRVGPERASCLKAKKPSGTRNTLWRQAPANSLRGDENKWWWSWLRCDCGCCLLFILGFLNLPLV